ncbi:MAG TPA: hypothetical protein VFN35_12920 [Ktedonobacteraceae bacterium]|nr:hypothetical protein [Ktedonobacteraceae bacterium]
MSKLFASHLLQTTKASSSVEGHYDPEQELWVGDNLLRGTTITHYKVWCQWVGVTYIHTGCGYETDEEFQAGWDDDEDYV